MPFLVFNIAVAAALIYLVSGGGLPIRDLMAQAKAPETAERVIDRVDQTNEQIRQAVARVMAELRQDGPEPQVSPIPVPEPDPLSASADNAAAASDAPPSAGPQGSGTPLSPKSLPPLAEAREIAQPARHEIDPAKARSLDRANEAPAGGDVSAPAGQRPARALALDAPAVRIEDGARLMTPQERLKELRAMSEDLEFMYLERRGG